MTIRSGGTGRPMNSGRCPGRGFGRGTLVVVNWVAEGGLSSPVGGGIGAGCEWRAVEFGYDCGLLKASFTIASTVATWESFRKAKRFSRCSLESFP